MSASRLLLLSALLLATVLFFYLGGADWLSFAALRDGSDQLRAWRDTHPVATTTTFFAVYVGITAISLPGATVLTLAAGALFGVLAGTVLASFASSLGALLAFLVARYVARAGIQRRFATRLHAIDQGIHRDGAFYLFSLRLVPAVPFFVINLLFGLTRMPAWRFYWVSQVGMLLGTVVFVNAGTRLAQLQSPAEILSPGMLLSFALLAVFPWLARGALAIVARRRVQSRWSRPARFDRNLIVIGAGAAGLVSAYIAATVRAKVTLIESHRMGGDCLNYGCVPSKALIRAARAVHQARAAARYGLEPAPAPCLSFREMMARVRRVVEAIAPHDSIERYTALGADVRLGHARLLDPWTVEITAADGGRERVTAHNIILATGARPFVPALPGLNEIDYLTSDTLWDRLADQDAAPERLVVLGGGPIGCELAQAFAHLGSRVTLVEMAPRLLLREDDDVAAQVHAALTKDGVEVRLAHRALRIERTGEATQLIVAGPGGEDTIAFDELLVAVGRQARLEGYGLEELGIPAKRTIETNDYLETIHPNIYAAGDIIGPYQFTHAAAHQAWYATVNALFGTIRKFRADYSVMPWVTFVDPEIARVGLNEREAAERGVAVEVTRYEWNDLDRAIIEGDTEGWIKVLTPPGRDTILGVTIVGAHAGELLPEFVLAMKYGLGLNRILATIHPYPTWAEANKYAAGAWKRAHAPRRLLELAETYHRWRRKAA